MKKLVIFIVVLITLCWTVPVIAKDKRNRVPKRDNRYEQRDHHDGYRYRYYGGKRKQRHRGHYRGHWRSYNHFEKHRMYRHRDYRRGRYYKRDNQLYFEFENEDGRFVFSIGR